MAAGVAAERTAKAQAVRSFEQKTKELQTPASRRAFSFAATNIPGLAHRNRRSYSAGMLRQAGHTLTIRASRVGLHDFTDDVIGWLDSTGIRDGLVTLFCRHTSASLVIQENAAPAAQRDLEAYFARLAPEDGPYEHDEEGPDDMPAHLRAALTQTQLTIPVRDGQLSLGTWQGIFLFEHRRGTPARQVVLHVIGE